MSEALTIMLWPLIACLLLPGILVYYGLHIVRREIIFVDLALAQVAALGICVAILLKHDAHDWQTYGWSLGDRKSTRLNSSHVKISYAVFCLKKKKKKKNKT